MSFLSNLSDRLRNLANGFREDGTDKRTGRPGSQGGAQSLEEELALGDRLDNLADLNSAESGKGGDLVGFYPGTSGLTAATLAAAVRELAGTDGSAIGAASVGLTDTADLWAASQLEAAMLEARTSQRWKAATTLTIASDSIAPTQYLHKVDTQAAAATDDLATITGGVEGQVIALGIVSAARVVTLKHGNGSANTINCPSALDLVLAATTDSVILRHNGTSWDVVAVSIANPAGGGLGASLALTTSGKGASLVGTQDAGGLFAGITKTVEAFFAAVRTRHILAAAATLTIASGAVTVTQSVHRIDTESSAAADDLDTISGGVVGQFIRVASVNAGRVTTIKHGTGNITGPLNMDVTLDATTRWVELFCYDGSNWAVVDADGWITNVLTGAAASVTINIPQVGIDFDLDLLLRGDTAATTTSVNATWATDTTSANYHYQRGGASVGAASTTSTSASNPLVIPAASGVASYFGWSGWNCPNFRNVLGSMVREFVIRASSEASGTQQTINVTVYRRITAGVGALTDAMSQLVLTPAAGNFAAGCVFRLRVRR